MNTAVYSILVYTVPIVVYALNWTVSMKLSTAWQSLDKLSKENEDPRVVIHSILEIKRAQSHARHYTFIIK
jgi:hypothetical protein